MSYYKAIDDVEQLRTFRKRREAFTAKVLVKDLLLTYPFLHTCEKLDREELWHYRHAQAAIADSRKHFMNSIYAMKPIRSRIYHDPRWLPHD
jgi:hypothetical protein